MCIQIVLNFGPLAREGRHLWCDNSPGEAGALMKAILMQMYVKHTHNEYIVSNNHINQIYPDWAVVRSELSGLQSCKMSCMLPEVQKFTTKHRFQTFLKINLSDLSVQLD